MKLREVRQHNPLAIFIIFLLFTVDISSYFLVYELTTVEFRYPIRVLMIILIAIYLSHRYSPTPMVSKLLEMKIIVKVTVGLLAIRFFWVLLTGDITLRQARYEFLFTFSFTICIIIFRLVVRTLQRELLKKGIGLRRTVIVGSGERSLALIHTLLVKPYFGFKLLGYSNNNQNSEINTLIPFLGNYVDLKEYIIDHSVQELIISLEKNEHDKLLEIMGLFSHESICIKILPDMYDALSGQMKMSHLNGIPLIDLNPDILTEYQKIIKRMGDIIVSLIGLIVSIPIGLIIGAIIKIESRGSVIFSQERIGKNHHPFTLYKFRSMMEDSEKETGPIWAEENDPRMTRFGKLLRVLRLDELPQFYNVLIGDMSLVGPRPERAHFIEKLKKEFPYYPRRLSVRPGITGWAQVVGEYDTTIENVKHKLKLDFYYIENISLALDAKILLMTVWTVLRRRGV